MSRPQCVVQVWDLPGEARPKKTSVPGVGSVLRSPGDATGLTRMGVHLRLASPGMAGTNRHFHTVEEEWAYIVSGRGTLRLGPHRIPVRPGSFAGFPPGPRPHHFIADGGEPLAILEGGERRPAEELGCYPDIPAWWQGNRLVDHPGPLPAEEGDLSQCLHIDDLPARPFEHDVDPQARRLMRRLNRASGLSRQAVVWTHVEPGAHSTAFHTHDRTDEWVFILSGRAIARLGDERFEVGPGDFIGHPAGGPAHRMEALESLTYLMGGQIDPEDVAIYPEAGLRRCRGQLSPL